MKTKRDLKPERKQKIIDRFGGDYKSFTIRSNSFLLILLQDKIGVSSKSDSHGPLWQVPALQYARLHL